MVFVSHQTVLRNTLAYPLDGHSLLMRSSLGVMHGHDWCKGENMGEMSPGENCSHSFLFCFCFPDSVPSIITHLYEKTLNSQMSQNNSQSDTSPCTIWWYERGIVDTETEFVWSNFEFLKNPQFAFSKCLPGNPVDISMIQTYIVETLVPIKGIIDTFPRALDLF